MTLRLIRDPREMLLAAEDLRRDGRRIALVPTMGYLHRGHVSLLEAGRRRCDALVLSIFVNPIQFGPSEDLARYPRDLDGDLDKARAAATDIAFVPDDAGMYREAPTTRILVGALAEGMCGARRPGHFAGVTTVVAKLFHLVQPHVAIFGEKDYQQLAVIRRMVRDLSFDVEIVGAPIVREPDGLAMSSRNAYLSPLGRQQALSLSRALAAAERLFAGGERDAARLVAAAAAELGEVRVDYVELRDADSLETLERVGERPAVLALAAFVGATRLIDNRILTPSK